MLLDEVSNMSKSQQARASVLAKLHYELTHLSYADQLKVTGELIADLRACIQQARTKKLDPPVDHFAKLRVESKPTKLLTAEKK